MKKCIIVYNPQSGIKSPFKNFKNFDRVFKKYGYETELIETSKLQAQILLSN